jgi:hypothetical protein
MMEFISIPIVVGIITLGIYRLFELFVRRKERILMLEKGIVTPTSFSPQMPEFSPSGFGTLKLACLLLGVGFGLLVGFFINMAVSQQIVLMNSNSWQMQETNGIIYGASIMLFGGLGLLLAFFTEQKQIAKKKQI